MNGTTSKQMAMGALNYAPILMFAAVLIVFATLSAPFRQPENAVNILVQTASTGILAVGMTFVLLTAGVDLSVGATMFVAGAIGSKLMLAGYPFAAALATMLVIGIAYGALNGVFITRLAIMAFVVTLATRYFGRGLALRITETRAMNLPESFYELGAARLFGMPVPVLIFAAVVLAAHFVLSRTPFGRHIYAVGADSEAARKAGIRTRWVVFMAYVICGLCAAIAAVVSLSQAPAISPTFGNNREFMAIAAAVLGGTSLFGGRGAVLPGTLIGAVLIQTIENGLNILNVNPYVYPLVISGVMLVAVLIDSIRSRMLTRLMRRRIIA